MRKEAAHEIVVMLLLIGISGVAFLQTASLTAAPPGQIAPATFPRLAAAPLAAMALLRLVLVVAFRFSPQGVDVDWSWARVGKPLLTAVLMVGYFLAFGHLHFLAATLPFMLAVYWVFGVRALRRAVLGAMVATGLLYVLFAFLLRVPI